MMMRHLMMRMMGIVLVGRRRRRWPALDHGSHRQAEVRDLARERQIGVFYRRVSVENAFLNGILHGYFAP